MNKLKIIFAGTGYFSAAYLQSLISYQTFIISVITKPDLPSGRGNRIIFSPVKKLSINNKIPLLQPDNLKDEKFYNKLLKLYADIMIVVSYGKIIPKKILNMFPKKCINVHPSLLPRWRGPTPIQSSILHGDKKTGISIINMDEKIDSGNIIYSKKCSISLQETTHSLSNKLIKIGTQALIKTLEKISRNQIIERKQKEKDAILSKKIYKKDALLNWNLEAIILERYIRAFNPWPVCYFKLKNQIIRVWKAKVVPLLKSNASIGEIILSDKNGIQINTSYQILSLQKLQFSGKKIMTVENILVSKKDLFKPGTII